jgi:type II secretory pathway component PulF
VDGELTAESRASALARIDELGYHVVSLDEVAARRATGRRRVTARDVTVFSRQLAGLLRAGVPILRALATIEQQTESARFQAVVADVVACVRDGSMLSQALARHPRHFSELYVSMVQSGEAGGVLDTVLLRLADEREKEEDLKSRVRAALAYPALILGVGLASVVVVLTLFLPRIARLFEDSRQPLPLATRAVLAAGHAMQSAWPWLLAAVLAASLLLRRLARQKQGRAWLDRLALRIPWVGRFLRDADLIRFADTLALLIRSGVSIERALPLAGGALRSAALQAALQAATRETVQAGASLAGGLQRHPEIPPFVTNMVAVGEEGGRLDETLAEVGFYYRTELDRELRWATTLLEPVLILLVGALLGFMIFALLLPIFDLGRTLG